MELLWQLARGDQIARNWFGSLMYTLSIATPIRHPATIYVHPLHPTTVFPSLDCHCRQNQVLP